MSPEDFGLIAPDLELRDAPRGEHIAGPDEVIDDVAFPEAGIVSVVAVSPKGQQVEAGMFGRDGFGPSAAILGSELSAHDVVVQVPGRHFRLPRAALLRATEGSSSLRTLLLKFVYVASVQIAQTALSNAVQDVNGRLARWILMVHDRSDADEIALTHEYISTMLAVRRPSITTSLHVLEGNRLIRSERGHIIIRDRPALEAFAADGYGKPEAEYRRLIGTL